MSLCVVLSRCYLSVSFHTCTHTLTHAQTHVYTFWNTGLPTRSHTFAYTHTNTCTCTRGHAHVHTRACTFTRAHTHYLVPTNTAQLIFCFEDCFLNQIKALQPTKEQRPSALESGGWTEQKQEACKSKACWGNAVSPFSPTSGVTC